MYVNYNDERIRLMTSLVLIMTNYDVNDEVFVCDYFVEK